MQRRGLVRPLTPPASADAGYEFDICFTSVQKRAIRTLWNVLDAIDQMWLPVVRTWRLNERHYGALSGRNKARVKEEVGADQLHRWRRGFADLPPQLEHRQHERRYDRLGVKMPLSESLAMTQKRLLPYCCGER